MFHNRVIEGLIALLLSDLHHAGNLMRLALADQVCNRRVHDQHFQRGHPSRLVDSPKKVLRHHALERFRQARFDLVLLVGRKYVDHAVDRLRSARSVQRAEDQVTSGRGGERQFDRLQIPHFTHEDDIRVFPQSAAQRRSE